MTIMSQVNKVEFLRKKLVSYILGGRKGKIPEEYLPIVKNVGQHFHSKIELGAGLDEVLKSDTPLLKHLNQGFKVTNKQCLIKNLKKVFIELMKNDETKAQLGKLQMVSPLILLGFTSSIDLEFNDFEEVESNEMLEPIMFTLSELL